MECGEDIVNLGVCVIKIKLPQLVKTEYLKPNPWNPNKVAKPEMDLLRVSIKRSGFCFPLIVIKESDTQYMIVDGYHRHLLAKEFKMEEVPVVVLDEPMSELMSATIRFNRAKGTHQVDRMIEMMGGKERFTQHLDSLFIMYIEEKYRSNHEDITRD